jgi:hypothetical protein
MGVWRGGGGGGEKDGSERDVGENGWR